MPLIPLALPVGFFRNGTMYQAKGRWFNGSLVRFADQTIRPIGGWARMQQLTADGVGAQQAIDLVGVPRGAHSWEVAGGQGYLGFGTTDKLYAFTTGDLKDITPTTFVPGNVDTTFTAGQTSFYGKGNYGQGPYGIGQPNLGVTLDADVWHLDNFGNFFVACLTPDNNGTTDKNRMWIWDLINAEAQPIKDGEVIGGETVVGLAPIAARGIVVTPEAFILALGADGNMRSIRWSDGERFWDWTLNDPTKLSGELTIPSVGRIVAGRAASNETLIWTDGELWGMVFQGGTFVYGFQKRGDNCGLIAPNAVAKIDSGFAWMGLRNFYFYSGYVRPLESDVQDYVFSDINPDQRQKIHAFVNTTFGEVWWFYPSEQSDEPDRYVIWNYREDHWETGDLARTASAPVQGATKAPIMLDFNGQVYQHEVGHDMKDLDNATDLVPFLESGPIEIAHGDQIVHILELIPDERTRIDPPNSVEARFFASFYPNDVENAFGPFTLGNPTSVRFSGRQVRQRIDQIIRGDWRVGVLRLEARNGGRR